ncbi:MAG: helix-turn-helix transcriptional regulator [Saprospiraceae bacterium]|nr:helix-turn-helix transcriptional regulator [Saprospiraceae bacterium]
MPQLLNDYPKLLKTIGVNIRKQEELANLCEMDWTYLSDIENAKFNVTRKKLCEIANVMEVDFKKILLET